MKLNELYTQLALVELNNLALASSGTISIEKRPQITLIANEALLRLYTRFLLKENIVLIEMQEAVTHYHLIKKYTHSFQQDPDNQDPCCLPYILDSVSEPFQEDVIKIMSVYDSFQCKLPLNDLEKIDSVFTPQNNIIQVPRPISEQALCIEYQARHPVLSDSDTNSEIELPEVLHGALRSYIASKVFMNMNTQESTVKGQEHMLNYETISQDVIDQDVVNSSQSTTNVRFEKRGWI